MKDFLPIRLHIARKLARLSMDLLVERTGGVVTKQSISRYERGVMCPKRDVMRALSKALSISEAYFFGENLSIDIPALRTSANNRLSQEEILQMEAQLSFWLEQYLGKEQQLGVQRPFENPLCDICVSTPDDAIRAANLLRERWHCGDGPISSVVRLIERKGVKIMSAQLPEGVWGMSAWADAKYPLIVLDFRAEKTTIERLRFTAVHELAHLLLSFSDESEFDEEKLCNKFASYFLFPIDTFIEELGAPQRTMLTLPELIDLKNVYGVSIAALVHEAWDLKMISRNHYDWWYDACIKKNPKEIGWGGYLFPETIGREHRLDSVLEIKLKGKTDKQP